MVKQSTRPPELQPTSSEKSERIWAEVRRMEQEREAKRVADAKAKAEAERLAHEEAQKTDALIRDATNWRDSFAVRDYIKRAAKNKGPEWAAWANAKAEELCHGLPESGPWLADDEWLSAEELAVLTGYVQPNAQIRQLEKYGLHAFRRSDGRVIVSRWAVRLKAAGMAAAPDSGIRWSRPEPRANLDWMQKGRPSQRKRSQR